MNIPTLREKIQQLYKDNPVEYDHEEFPLFTRFKELLNTGEIRSAEPTGDTWQAVDWVKEGILIGFRMGHLTDYSLDDQFRYFDKHTYPLKDIELENKIRQVPGGSSIRDGAYVAKGVVIMPPAYINVGAYVDEGTMVDSHALVGSCAQIGKSVHLSAGTQIGGVLEPVNATPVVVEDDVLVGGNCGIYEGTIVKRRAVIAAGVILTASTPVYDLVNEEIITREQGGSLTIPEGAVVVSGSREITSDFGQHHGLSKYTPIIVKYRDEKTDRSIALEDALR